MKMDCTATLEFQINVDLQVSIDPRIFFQIDKFRPLNKHILVTPQICVDIGIFGKFSKNRKEIFQPICYLNFLVNM